MALTWMAVCAPVPDAAPRTPAAGIRTAAGVEVTAVDPLPAKAQGAGGASLFAEARLNSWLGLGLAAGVHFTAPSDLSEGFQYRGHWGADLRPYLSLRWLERPASDAVELAVGNLVGPVLRYDGYLLTYRYFFFMGAGLEPFLELHFRNGKQAGRHSLVISVPVELYFRPELALSAAGGLALWWKLYFPRAGIGGPR
jgi:hypothetical protein